MFDNDEQQYKITRIISPTQIEFIDILNNKKYTFNPQKEKYDKLPTELAESQLKGLVKKMIKEATVDDLFPMDDDVRKLFFTKDMETMGDEKIQQLLNYVNKYENYCIQKLQSAISLNKEQRKIVIRNLYNQMDRVLQENNPMQDRRTYDKGKGAISRVLRGITDGLEYLFKITSTLSEDKFNTFYNTPTFSDYNDYSLSNFINLYNQRIDENIKLFMDDFNSNNIISKNKYVQDLVKECIKDYELNFYEKFSKENAGEKFMQNFTKLIIQKRPNLKERIGMGNTTINESQLRGIVKRMIKEELTSDSNMSNDDNVSGVYLVFNKNGQLENFMRTKDTLKDDNLKRTIESKGQYNLYWTTDMRFLKVFSYPSLINNYKGKTMDQLGLK
jgi:hypothetical protein